MQVTFHAAVARRLRLLVGVTILGSLLVPAGVPAVTPSRAADVGALPRVSEQLTDPPAAPAADGVLVKFRFGVQPAHADRLTLAKQPWVVRAQQDRYVVLAVPAGEEADQVKQLLTDPAVEYAEPNWIRQAHDTLADQWYVAQVGATAAHHTVGSGNASTRIAIVDTGIDGQHPRLRSRIVPGYDVVNNDAAPDDDQGHGTMVAGVASAICPTCSLLPVKVLNGSGGGSDYMVSSGIRYAADHGSHVINLSLGGENPSQTLCEAVTYAQQKGALVVAAAGNDGRAQWSYPANCNADVLRIGATGPDDALAAYSNTGFELDLVAPGGATPNNLHPANDRLMVSTCRGGGYCGAAGTSLATPAAAGAAGLVRSAQPTLSAQQVATTLLRTADDLGAHGYDDASGWGRLNVARAVGVDASPRVLDARADPGWVTAQGGTVTMSAYVRDDRQVVRATVRVPSLGVTVAMQGNDRYVGSIPVPATMSAAITGHATVIEVDDSAGHRTTIAGPTIYQSATAWEGSAWPMRGHDAQQTKQSFDTLTVPPTRIATIQPPQPISQRACSHGAIYIFCGAGGTNTALRAIDAATGQPTWELSAATGANIGEGNSMQEPVFHQGTVVFIDGRGVVTAATADRGTIVWQTQVDLPNRDAAMVVQDNILYIPSEDTMMTALDMTNGKVVWYQPWSYSFGEITATPTVVGGVVIVPIYDSIQDTSYVLALDARTGVKVWQSAELAGQVYDGMLGHDGSLYFATLGQFSRMDAATGTMVWTKHLEDGLVYGIAKGAVTAAGLIVVTLNGDEPQMLAFDTAGTVRWRTDVAAYGQQPSAPMVIGTDVVVGTGAARLLVVDAGTGQIRWASEPLGAAGWWFTPLWDGQRVLWSSADGSTTKVLDMQGHDRVPQMYVPLVRR